MTSDELIDELQKATLRGRGGAGFPMGRKASLIDRKSAKPKYLVVNADESEPGAFKDRQVMATVPHRLIEGCLIAAHAIESTRRLHLHPRRVPDGVRDPRRRGRGGAQGEAPRRRRDHRPSRRRRVHLRRGDRAARVARGKARPAAPAPAVPADPGPLHGADADQQRLHDRDRPAHPRHGRGGVREDRRAELAGHRDLLRLGERRAAGQLRAAARDADAHAHLRLRAAASPTAAS